eukprot:CAMPEP_0183484436 /NCGR_PEP_ID=MMETSP0370-20130417/178919_1 /TAXON_ID=268820 /ORGANISM="Peridinium aciculiferum, Strain PAER-2" /LENGTH=130 /DNA_ID=CAMNT_0025677727 /DNA_START=430 /DNA_END=824 /DNA_ORIENTATION=-
MDWQERDDHGCHGGKSAEVCAPWKTGGEVNDLVFDQYAERRTMDGLEIHHEDDDECVDEQGNERFQLKRLALETKQEVNSDRILRDGDERGGYGGGDVKNVTWGIVLKGVCEPSDGREKACPTVTTTRTV